MPFDFSTAYAKAELITFALTALSLAFNFFAVLTPSWHVAEDLDAHRDVQSGLWQYCQGGQSCWYIFSDNLINYYERADICRFLLIGDCRKKLLRTPYFFGWHYAVLIMMLISITLTAAAVAGVLLAHLRPNWKRIGHVTVLCLLGTALLVEGIGLAVFMINGEMLESRYLIGIQNTFEKHYGYSFYLAFLGNTFLLFAVFASLFCATYHIFFNTGNAGSAPEAMVQYAFDPYGRPISTAEWNYNLAKEAAMSSNIPSRPPNYYSASEISGPTRTFISY